jgi:transcriptional regulator with XRE-family HTH domain
MMDRKHRRLASAIGTALRQLREKAGLSQETLGFEFELHRTYISMLERGQRMPSVPTLFALGEFLGASPVEVMRIVERELGAAETSRPVATSKRRAPR